MSPAQMWQAWIGQVWLMLADGDRVTAPEGMPHPAYGGFVRPRMSEPRGQSADWVLPLSDGSRIHVHEYADGRLVAHRDRHDPGQGIARAAMHVATETKIGKGAMVAGTIYNVLKWVGV